MWPVDFKWKCHIMIGRRRGFPTHSWCHSAFAQLGDAGADPQWPWAQKEAGIEMDGRIDPTWSARVCKIEVQCNFVGRAKQRATFSNCESDSKLPASHVCNKNTDIFVHLKHDSFWRRRREKSCSSLSFNCDTKSDSRCLFSSPQFSLVNWKMEVEMMDNHR